MLRKKENEKYFKIAVTGVVILLIGMVCFFLFYRIRGFGAFFKDLIGILEPFIYGFVIAYVLRPTCRWWEKHLRQALERAHIKHAQGIAAALAITFCEILALTIVIALFMLVIPQLITSIMSLISVLPDQLDNANTSLHDLLEKYPTMQQSWDELYAELSTRLKEWLKTDLTPMLQTIINGLSIQVVNIVGFLKNAFLGLIVSIYLLAGRRRFLAQGRLVLFSVLKEKWAKLVEDEIIYADKMFSGFLMGKLLDSLIIGVICFVCTYLMGIKSALLVSVVVGVTNIIPFFGPYIGAIPSTLWLLLENPLHAVYFLIFIIILQQIDGNIIGPKILGNSTGLSSFWVLFSILFFGGLWGFVGMIIGVPFFAVVYDIITRLVMRGLHRNQKTDMLAAYDEQYVKNTKKTPRQEMLWAEEEAIEEALEEAAQEHSADSCKSNDDENSDHNDHDKDDRSQCDNGEEKK